MAGVGSLEVSADAQRTTDSAVAVLEDVEIYVPGVVDLEAERARLTKQLDELAKNLEKARKKLSNEAFVQKAKPEVVEQERGRVTRFEAELAGVEANLAELG